MKAILMAVVMVAAMSGGAQAAIDCSRARSNAEKMLCSNTRLSEADDRMARVFRQAIHHGADPATLMESQRKWLSEVRDSCNDVECMLKAYADRIADLEQF